MTDFGLNVNHKDHRMMTSFFFLVENISYFIHNWLRFLFRSVLKNMDFEYIMICKVMVFITDKSVVFIQGKRNMFSILININFEKTILDRFNIYIYINSMY